MISLWEYDKAHELTPGFQWGSRFLIFRCSVLKVIVCPCSVNHCVPCLSFTASHYLLVSSNSSY